MAVIKLLDEILANKIAAGEVVERCSSVVKELVENSIDANSTEIKVELIDAGTKEIKVTDNGKGMDKEDLERVEELFYTTKKNGTGVGVALCKEIINAHEGTIEYESKLNKGTKVLIKLPILK